VRGPVSPSRVEAIHHVSGKWEQNGQRGPVEARELSQVGNRMLRLSNRLAPRSIPAKSTLPSLSKSAAGELLKPRSQSVARTIGKRGGFGADYANHFWATLDAKLRALLARS